VKIRIEFLNEKSAISHSSEPWEKSKVLRTAGRQFLPNSKMFSFELKKAKNALFVEINVFNDA